MVVLLRWWLMFCLSLVLLVGSYYFGYLQALGRVDHTYLGYTNIVLYFLMSLFMGLQTFRAYHDPNLVKRPTVSFGWFMSESMMGIGMIGTLIGFLLMFKGFIGDGIDLNNLTTQQRVISGMASGMSTSCVTTVVGLMVSLMAKAQMVNLGYLVESE